MFELELVDATFGAYVRGIDLRALDDATWLVLHEACWTAPCSSSPASS